MAVLHFGIEPQVIVDGQVMLGRALSREIATLGHLDNWEEISSDTVRARQAGGRFLPEAGGGMF